MPTFPHYGPPNMAGFAVGQVQDMGHVDPGQGPPGENDMKKFIRKLKTKKAKRLTRAIEKRQTTIESMIRDALDGQPVELIVDLAIRRPLSEGPPTRRTAQQLAAAKENLKKARAERWKGRAKTAAKVAVGAAATYGAYRAGRAGLRAARRLAPKVGRGVETAAKGTELVSRASAALQGRGERTIQRVKEWPGKKREAAMEFIRSTKH